MLWLGQRARQLARVAALPTWASAPHQLRNPADQRVAGGVARYSILSLYNQPSTSDISHAGVAQHSARLPGVESTTQLHEQLIKKQHGENRPAQTLDQQKRVEAIADNLIATLRRALQHRNGGAAQARATASADVLSHLTNHPHLLSTVAANPLQANLLLHDLARCGPVAPHLMQPAAPALHHLLTAAVEQCPPDALLGNVQALVELNVPLPVDTSLQAHLQEALVQASPHRTADLLWFVLSLPTCLAGHVHDDCILCAPADTICIDTSHRAFVHSARIKPTAPLRHAMGAAVMRFVDESKLDPVLQWRLVIGMAALGPPPASLSSLCALQVLNQNVPLLNAPQLCALVYVGVCRRATEES